MREDLWLTLSVGALCGAAVGMERQWSGHAEGDAAHFGGLRTFTLLGMIGGVAGWLWTNDAWPAGALLLGGAVGLIVAAYVAASTRDVDGTTEVAALIALAAGLLVGFDHADVASGMVAVTVLLLAEKTRLHGLVRLFDDRGFRAGARFAVMALVVLPLLPQGPLQALGGIRPRQLWTLVLLFSGLNFAGYVARALIGERHGLRITGLVGGLVSSTSVTLTFARLSRDPVADRHGLAAGAVAACTVLFPRVVIAAGLLSSALVAPLVMLLLAPFGVGVAATILCGRQKGEPQPTPLPANPLQLGAALQMALLFQVVSFAIDYAQRFFGNAGIAASAVATGLTDVDALTASFAVLANEGLPPTTAAAAIAIGIAANTVMKLGLSIVIGRGAFRLRTAVALVAMALGTLAPLTFLPR